MKHVKDGLAAMAVACGLLGPGGFAHAQSPSLRALAPEAPQSKPAQPHRSFWDLGQYTWMRLTPREPGAAPNDAPSALEMETLLQKLGTIRASTPDGDEVLFAPSELAGLAKAMGEALALADAGEDLVLFSSSRRGHGFLSSPLAVAARLFLKDGALNLIVQDPRMEVLGRYSPDGDWSRINYGSRVRPSQVTLRCPGALSRRGDWLVFALDRPLPEAPVATPLPAPPTAPVSVHPEQEQRLRHLKHLLEEKLITEKEYQAKRAEIIKTL